MKHQICKRYQINWKNLEVFGNTSDKQSILTIWMQFRMQRVPNFCQIESNSGKYGEKIVREVLYEAANYKSFQNNWKKWENFGNTSGKQSVLTQHLKTTNFFQNNKNESKLKVKNLEHNGHQIFDKFQSVYTGKDGKILPP